LQTISLEGDAHAQRRHLFRFAVMAIVAAERSKRRPAFSLWPVRTEALRSALRASLFTRIWRSLGLREGPLLRSGNLSVQRTGRSADTPFSTRLVNRPAFVCDGTTARNMPPAAGLAPRVVPFTQLAAACAAVDPIRGTRPAAALLKSPLSHLDSSRLIHATPCRHPSRKQTTAAGIASTGRRSDHRRRPARPRPVSLIQRTAAGSRPAELAAFGQ
jgi:hypothetical protein